MNGSDHEGSPLGKGTAPTDGLDNYSTRLRELLSDPGQIASEEVQGRLDEVEAQNPEEWARCMAVIRERRLMSEYKQLQRRRNAASSAGQPARPSAEGLLALLDESGATVWRTPGHEVHVKISRGDHVEHYTVQSTAFRRWIAAAYFERTGTAARQETIRDACGILEGRALNTEEVHAAHLRVGCDERGIFVDLGDVGRRVVAVTPGEWRVLASNDVPFRFVRRDGMLPLAPPQEGGTVEALRSLFSASVDEDAFKRAIAWLLCCLTPGPYPILLVRGEQGSGKSSFVKALRMMIDPHHAPLRRPPQGERDLAVALVNGFVLALDNLSGARGLSDALCTAATGGGFGARAHYTNADEVVVQYRRPVAISAITFDARADLADRILPVQFGTLADDRRKAEQGIERELAKVQPLVLGALMDAAADGLRRLPMVRAQHGTLPRLADAALWVEACGPTLGWRSGEGLRLFHEARRASMEAVIESEPVAQFILGMRLPWEGRMTDLAEAFCRDPTWRVWSNKLLPSPRGLRALVDRIAPALRYRGIAVDYDNRSSDRRPFRLSRTEPEEPS